VQTVYIRNVHQLKKTQVYAVSDDAGSPSSNKDIVPAAEKVKKDNPLVPENEQDLDPFYSLDVRAYSIEGHNSKFEELNNKSIKLNKIKVYAVSDDSCYPLTSPGHQNEGTQGRRLLRIIWRPCTEEEFDSAMDTDAVCKSSLLRTWATFTGRPMVLKFSITSVKASTLFIETTIDIPTPGVDGKTPPGSLHPRLHHNQICTTLQQCFRYDPSLRRLEWC
jgi:hypothetical protein